MQRKRATMWGNMSDVEREVFARLAKNEPFAKLLQPRL
jgi:hypothetical protein